MTIYYDRFVKFQALLTEFIPGLNVQYKDQSLFMKVLGKILFFNPKFTTGFITTIGSTVYFPTQAELTGMQDYGELGILAHESRHIYDSKKIGKVLFTLSYLFPQILSVIALLLCILSWKFIFLFAVLLAPLPAPWRKVYEFSGYTMDLFVNNELMKELNISEEDRRNRLNSALDDFNSYFTSFDYYVMYPFGVKEQFSEIVEKIISGTIVQDDDIYNKVAAALAASK